MNRHDIHLLQCSTVPFQIGSELSDHEKPTGRQVISTKFSRTDCARCTVNKLCTKNGARNSRKLSLRPREEYDFLIASRAEQHSPEWKQLYNGRAGIEATFSQRCSLFGPEANTISRFGEVPFTKCCHRLRDQPPTAQRLLERNPSCHNTHLRPSTARATRHVRFRQQCPVGNEPLRLQTAGRSFCYHSLSC